MICKNIDDTVSKYEQLPDFIKLAFDAGICCVCDRKFKPNDSRDIDYVLCSNGEIRWWHSFTPVKRENNKYIPIKRSKSATRILWVNCLKSY